MVDVYEKNHNFLTQGIPLAPKPPDSPDLSTGEFFPKLKNVLKRRHFGTTSVEHFQRSISPSVCSCRSELP